MVVWCRDDYIKEVNKQLEEKTVYKDVNFKETILLDLVHKSNETFKSLYTSKFLRRKNSNTFPMISRKTTNRGKLYLLPRIQKRLSNVPGRPIISNCGTPTERSITVS